jgi:UDP-glucuronate 4-epimerase
MKKILVTGSAGFIGFHLCQRLLQRGDKVVGIDNLNDYYDVFLKQARLAQLKKLPNFSFQKLDLANQEGMTQLFATQHFDGVVNLAAQVGVRFSVKIRRLTFRVI